MENFNSNFQTQPPNYAQTQNPQVSEQSVQNLHSASKWMKFLSVLGFIFLSLISIGLIIFAIATSSKSKYSAGSFATGPIILIVIISDLIYIFPIIFLFQYSSYLKSFFITRNPIDLDNAFSKQKLYFKYIGILVIVILSIYLIVLIFVLSTASLLQNRYFD
jgi:hypothetical protein